MADLSLDLCGVKLKNPIIAASGTFGFGREYDDCMISAAGRHFRQGIGPAAAHGNPPSRIAETPSGMLNSVGLQNPGVESFIENDLPWLLTKNVAVIANITGTSVEQYVQMAERLAGTGVHLLEMNISCPNVHEGGVAFGVKPWRACTPITKAVKAAAKQPLIVKLTPNVSDITENALAAEEAGANAISMINTLTGHCGGHEQTQNGAGQQHGRPVRPAVRRLRCAWSGRAPKRCIFRLSAWAASKPARTRRRSCSAARRPSWSARRISPIRSPARASFGNWTRTVTGRM